MPRKSNTRAASGAGTIRQRANGGWEGRYTIGRDPGTGKQIQKSVYGKTQAEVSKKLREVTTQIDNGTYQEPQKMTLSEWLDIWLAEYSGGIKQATWSQYTGHSRNHIKPKLGNIPLQKLNTHTIQKFYNGLKNANDGSPLAPKTVKNIHGILHAALKQATVIGYIKSNPADNCIMPRIEHKEMNVLTDHQVNEFLKAIKDNPYELIYFVGLFTGMRKSEILALTWDCVDFDNGTMLVNKQLLRELKKGGKYFIASLKNDKPRRITPAPSVMQRLKEHKAVQSQERLLAGSAWEIKSGLDYTTDIKGSLPLEDHIKSGLVFTTNLGKHLYHRNVYNHYKRIVTGMGIKELRQHDLRHSYAVNSLQCGDDVKTLQENLGHHTAGFTLQQYGHVSETMKRASAERMEQFIKQSGGNV